MLKVKESVRPLNFEVLINIVWKRGSFILGDHPLMKLMLSQLFLVVVENNEPRKVVQEEKTCDSKGNK